MFRFFLPIAAAVAGVLVGAMSPELSAYIRSGFASFGSPGETPGRASGHSGQDHGEEGPSEEGAEGKIALTPDQIAAARIDVAPVAAGTLKKQLAAPGTVAADPDRVARVAAKVVGTVADMRKRLGDPVKKGELIAIIESREVADAKNDFLGATVQYGLQTELFERERMLFERKVSAEQQFLRAKTALAEAQLRVDLSRQKLAALDLTEAEIAALPKQPIESLKRQEIRAPRSGRIVERRVDLGAPVGGEGQEKELYVIADLSTVWVDLAVPAAEIAQVREGQAITAQQGEVELKGRIIFISPTLRPETRSARIVAEFPNPYFTLRSGAFLSTLIAFEEAPVDVLVPRAAVQSVNGEQIVFVRTPEGFERREVVLGESDSTGTQVVFGLDPGEEIAVTNTFTLKAELGKAEAEHSH